MPSREKVFGGTGNCEVVQSNTSHSPRAIIKEYFMLALGDIINIINQSRQILKHRTVIIFETIV